MKCEFIRTISRNSTTVVELCRLTLRVTEVQVHLLRSESRFRGNWARKIFQRASVERETLVSQCRDGHGEHKRSRDKLTHVTRNIVMPRNQRREWSGERKTENHWFGSLRTWSAAMNSQTRQIVDRLSIRAMVGTICWLFRHNTVQF